MTLFAKSIIKNRLWIITDGKSKIGNIKAINDRFYLKLGNKQEYYSSTDSIEKSLPIKFEKIEKNKENNDYKSVIDVQKKVHLFTKTDKSKCYHASGYFCILIGKKWKLVHDPKYIVIQRYSYHGPFQSESDAEKLIISLVEKDSDI